MTAAGGMQTGVYAPYSGFYLPYDVSDSPCPNGMDRGSVWPYACEPSAPLTYSSDHSGDIIITAITSLVILGVIYRKEISSKIKEVFE